MTEVACGLAWIGPGDYCDRLALLNNLERENASGRVRRNYCVLCVRSVPAAMRLTIRTERKRINGYACDIHRDTYNKVIGVS